jgi:hypothetical protein
MFRWPEMVTDERMPEGQVLLVNAPQTAAERERVAWRMGYTAGRTDERMRQWREQTNGSASEEAELGDRDGD